MQTPPRLSIVIPVYEEQEGINNLLRHLDGLQVHGGKEIVVVDGAPDCTTLQAVDTALLGTPLTLLPAAAGRAIQMNLGAERACGEILLFLHADTFLPPDGLHCVHKALADPKVIGGAFSLRIQSASPLVRLIGHGTTLRSRMSRIPFGDQAIFIRRECFLKFGGFPTIPIMEDLEFMLRLRRLGKRIVILPRTVLTSGRRWEKEGALACSLRNMTSRLLYRLGVAPETLASRYRRHKE